MKHSIETQRDWQKSVGFNSIKTHVYFKHKVIPYSIKLIFEDIPAEQFDKYLTTNYEVLLEKALTDYFEKEKDFHKFAKQIFN